MSATTCPEADSDVEYTPEYGDKFRHIITGKEYSVQDVRDGKVTWSSGGFDYVGELQGAVEEGGSSLYEPVSVGDGAWEGDGYGDY